MGVLLLWHLVIDSLVARCSATLARCCEAHTIRSPSERLRKCMYIKSLECALTSLWFNITVPGPSDAKIHTLKINECTLILCTHDTACTVHNPNLEQIERTTIDEWAACSGRLQ